MCRNMRCSLEHLGIHLQGKLVRWLRSKGEDEAANWFEKYWCGPIKGCWLLSNIGIGGVTNQQGIESSHRWDRVSIGCGHQVCVRERDVCVCVACNADVCVACNAARARCVCVCVWRVTPTCTRTPTADTSSFVLGKHDEYHQLEADLAAGGTPNAFPSVPVTCNLEWDLLQQMHPYTLVCTVSLTDREHTWRNAVRQVSGVQKGIIAVEAMRDIVHNLGVPSRKISPTSHAGVLLMPSQTLMRQINLSNGNTAHVKVLTDAVQREVDAF